MKDKITILIVTSIVALLALSSIQGYLINESYQLKKKAFLSETDDAMSHIHFEKETGGLFDEWVEDLKNHLADYKSDRITKQEVIKRSKLMADSLNKAYTLAYEKKLDTLDLGYEVNYKTNLVAINIIENRIGDSIYPFLRGEKTKLFGEDFNENEAITINVSRLFSEYDYITNEEDQIVTKSFDLEVKTEQRILIKDWKSIVIGRMSLLLVASISIFLFVIGLLYYSIKNLITQKKTAEIKTDFINNITHELKTPLATLGIASKSLRNETIKNDATAFSNTLSIVERQNNRLQKLIDQVLTNSLSSEDIVLSKEGVLDNQYFNDLLQDFKLSTQRQDMIIIEEIFVPEVMLRIDRFHFTTALFNILENAVKYGNKEKTEIKVVTQLKNGHYHIRISDNGVGILEKDQKNIFDKFYRVSDGNVHDVKGLGLGLFYTSQIVKAHEGFLSLESEVNKGTTFHIKIPVN